MQSKRRLRLVVDTNIFVSAQFSMARGRQSLERTLFELIASDPQPPLLIVSSAILDEYEDVFHRPQFAFGPYAAAVLNAVRQLAHHVQPSVEIRQLKDPDDTKFLAAALDGGAHYLVTRNKRDYPDWTFIVTVKEFMQIEYPELLG